MNYVFSIRDHWVIEAFNFNFNNILLDIALNGYLFCINNKVFYIINFDKLIFENNTIYLFQKHFFLLYKFKILVLHEFYILYYQINYFHKIHLQLYDKSWLFKKKLFKVLQNNTNFNYFCKLFNIQYTIFSIKWFLTK